MIIFIDDDHLLSLVDGQALLHGHLLQVHVAGELESNLEEKIFNSKHSVFFQQKLGMQQLHESRRVDCLQTDLYQTVTKARQVENHRKESCCFYSQCVFSVHKMTGSVWLVGLSEGIVGFGGIK